MTAARDTAVTQTVHDMRRMFVRTISRELVRLAIRRGWMLNDLTLLIHTEWHYQEGPEC